LDTVNQFISNGCDFADFIDSSVWLSLGRRVVEGFSDENVNCRFLHAERTFSPSSKSIDGMISYLTTKSGGNIHDKGLTEATASGIYKSSPSYHPKNAIDLQNRSSCFESSGKPNSWICYDFKDMEVTPSHYAILPFQLDRISTNTKSLGVWKFPWMENHERKSIDGKTTQI
jgi:hypothetical protein